MYPHPATSRTVQGVSDGNGSVTGRSVLNFLYNYVQLTGMREVNYVHNRVRLQNVILFWIAYDDRLSDTGDGWMDITTDTGSVSIPSDSRLVLDERDTESAVAHRAASSSSYSRIRR